MDDLEITIPVPVSVPRFMLEDDIDFSGTDTTAESNLEFRKKRPGKVFPHLVDRAAFIDTIRLSVDMESMTDNSGVVHQFDQNLSAWPFADGDIVHSDRHSGCVIVDNPRMQQRLVLDFTDRDHPKGTRTWMPLPTGAQACGCPPEDRCLPLRFQ